MSTVKRVFYYLLCAVTLGFLTNGAQTVLRQLFDLLRPDGADRFSTVDFSLGIASFVIGGFLWFLFWRATQRQAASPAETGTGLRKFYLNAILLISSLQGIVTFSVVLGWLFGGPSLDTFVSSELATLFVAAALWTYHSRIENREGQPSPAARTLRRWYVYIFSGFTLSMLATSLIMLIQNAVVSLPVWGAEAVSSRFWGFDTADSVAWIIAGGLGWWYAWFRMAKDDIGSTSVAFISIC
jgi:hypothetical protein